MLLKIPFVLSWLRLPGWASQSLLARLRGLRQQQRQRRQDLQALRQMGDRELSDLGIGRGDIAALVDTPHTWRNDRR